MTAPRRDPSRRARHHRLGALRRRAGRGVPRRAAGAGPRVGGARGCPGGGGGAGGVVVAGGGVGCRWKCSVGGRRCVHSRTGQGGWKDGRDWVVRAVLRATTVIFGACAHGPREKKRKAIKEGNKTKRWIQVAVGMYFLLMFPFEPGCRYRGGHGRRETPFKSSTTSLSSSHAPI